MAIEAEPEVMWVHESRNVESLEILEKRNEGRK